MLNELGGSAGPFALTPYYSVSYSVFFLSVFRIDVKKKTISFLLADKRKPASHMGDGLMQ